MRLSAAMAQAALPERAEQHAGERGPGGNRPRAHERRCGEAAGPDMTCAHKSGTCRQIDGVKSVGRQAALSLCQSANADRG